MTASSGVPDSGEIYNMKFARAVGKDRYKKMLQLCADYGLITVSDKGGLYLHPETLKDCEYLEKVWADPQRWREFTKDFAEHDNDPVLLQEVRDVMESMTLKQNLMQLMLSTVDSHIKEQHLKPLGDPDYANGMTIALAEIWMLQTKNGRSKICLPLPVV